MRCEKCKSELIEYRNGEDIEYICPVCDEAPSTQIDNLIEFDSNRYSVKLLPIAKYEKDLLKSVAKLCSCNFLEAKRIVEVTGKEFEPMDAIDTLKLKEQIEEVGIPYVITPKFNW